VEVGAALLLVVAQLEVAELRARGIAAIQREALVEVLLCASGAALVTSRNVRQATAENRWRPGPRARAATVVVVATVVAAIITASGEGNTLGVYNSGVIDIDALR
ncbi:Hypothetical protein POVN_LOCUS704, partial [uncultured virus]